MVHTDILRRHFVPSVCSSSSHRSLAPAICALPWSSDNGDGDQKKTSSKKEVPWWDPTRLGVAPPKNMVQTSWIWQVPEKLRKDGAQRLRYLQTWEENAKKWIFTARTATVEGEFGPGGFLGGAKKWAVGDMAQRATDTARLAEFNAEGKTAVSEGEKNFLKDKGVDEAWEQIGVAWRRAARSTEEAAENGWTAARARSVAIATNRTAQLALTAAGSGIELEEIAAKFTEATTAWEETKEKLLSEKGGKEELRSFELEMKEEDDKRVKEKERQKGAKAAKKKTSFASGEIFVPRKKAKPEKRGFGLFAWPSQHLFSTPAVVLIGLFVGSGFAFTLLQVKAWKSDLTKWQPSFQRSQ